ncbi:META domain-containing protein [Gilliamella sp. B2969]|uniref:META domain-containing protein n=1 Tax=Gilliamella sp. B2969 TaxID=2818021 RepID=UPI00226A69CB|nr:META domain-containing protein [Gilliamella sp. B2969]MCX8729116.1 META domain-containing protein [Gilliamella sp. B2969]
MKKTIGYISLLTAFFTLFGCGESGKIKDTDLMHHHFVLIKANGQDVALDKQADLEFGEKMTITGKMCNQFSGQVTLKNDEIKGVGVAMTKMLCNDDQLDKLDIVIDQLISNGAKVELTNNQLILKNKDNELIYQVKEWM